MSDLSLTIQMIDQLNSGLLKQIDPALSIPKSKAAFLDESFHQIDLLEKMDPSHFDVLLESYPKRDILFFRESLKKKQDKALFYFINEFSKKALNEHYPTLPYKYIPAFEGSRLLKLNFSQLHTLIHLLGIYDIRFFLKTSIDQKLHVAIDQQLSDLEKKFLTKIKLEKEKVTFKKMPLDSWDRSKDSFLVMKYTRGLNRLSKAVSFESQYIHNEILLRLPLKEKQSFMTLKTQTDAQFTKTLYEEINEALDFLDKARPKSSTNP